MGAIGQIIGGITQGSAANSAAGAIAAQDQNAIAGQKAQYQTTANNLNPYIQTGTNNLGAYGNEYQQTQNTLGTAFTNAQNATNKVGTSTLADLQALPGYQQMLQQGLQSTQASAAARGLGVSGASLKAASNYSTGLASQQYQQLYQQQVGQAQLQQNQYNLANTGQNTIYNQLQGTVGTGLNAANDLGNYGQQSANQISGAYSNIGNAQAAGINSQAANYASALNGVGNLLGGGSGGQPATASGFYNSLTNFFS